MVIEQEPSFDPKSFLAKVGEGRTIGKYRKDPPSFRKEISPMRSSISRKARSRSPLFPRKGRKQSSQCLGRMNSAAKVAWRASPGAWRQLRQ